MVGGLYIGVDLGTTGVKVGLFDESGRGVGLAWRETHLDTPAPGFAEFDGEAYIDSAFDGIREVLASPDARAENVKAIGVSSQAQTFLIADEAGRALRPALSWLDVRAETEAEDLVKQAVGLDVTEINPIQSAPKLLWLSRHEPEVMARVRHVFVIPDYLIFRLTGRSVTDAVFASSTGAYEKWQGAWIEGILRACGVTIDQMPEVRRPGERAGHLTAAAARDLGLAEDVLVAVGTNDQPAGALGAGNVTPGCASLALGTALAIVGTSDTRDRVPPGVGVVLHPATTVADGPGALYSLLAYAKTAGIVIRWFRDTFTPSRSYDQLFEGVASVSIGAEGLTCLPHFSGTATPDFNASARGAFYGLTLAHTREHLARALAESLAFTVRENLELLGPVVAIEEIRAIGGGSRSDVWLQMIADAAGVPVVRAGTNEAACLGAAALAMVAAGRFTSVAEASQSVYHPGRRFKPNAEAGAQYTKAFARYRSLYESLYGRKDQDG